MPVPASLPFPSQLAFTAPERRALSEDAGPREARALQIDRLTTQRLQWRFSDAEAEDFQAWWETDLVFGGAWFAATWQLPQGFISGVRRFIGPPRWAHGVAGFWVVTAELEVRGRGVAPA